MSDSSLSFYLFDDCLWIRCAGRGCFINSPNLKSIAEKYLQNKGSCIVVDLEICPGVDSTFMGTLAGLARKCTALGGCLQIASPTQRTRSAMENLGLDMLVDIDPNSAPWRVDVEARRAKVSQEGSVDDGASSRSLTEMDRTRHVLEAHNTLRSMNHQNDEAFGYVCETLEEDLMRHETQDDAPA